GHRRVRRAALGGVAPAGGAGVPPPADRRGGRRAGHALPADRHPPVAGPYPLARPGPGRPAVLAGGPGPRRGGRRFRPGLVGGAAVRRGDLPGRGVPVLAVVVRGGDRVLGGVVRADRLGGGAPGAVGPDRHPRAGPTARRQRLRHLLLGEPGPVLRLPGLDEQRPGSRGHPRARHHADRHHLDPVAERGRRRAHRRADGRQRRGRRLLRADQPARDPRADRGVRRRRRRAPARLGLGGPRAAAPRAGAGRGRPGGDHRRARPGRGAADQRGDRGVRHAVAAADLGPDRDRRTGRGAVPRLRLAVRPARGPRRRDRRPGGRPARGHRPGRL
ncbi:MAG: SpoIIM, partial [uncultured Corynebacteriales bacterium]